MNWEKSCRPHEVFVLWNLINHYYKLHTMKQLRIILFAIALVLAFGWQNVNAQEKLTSPDGKLELQFEVKDGVPYYSLDRNGKPVVLPSKMGFTLEWRDDLAHAFVLKDV